MTQQGFDSWSFTNQLELLWQKGRYISSRFQSRLYKLVWLDSFYVEATYASDLETIEHLEVVTDLTKLALYESPETPKQ
ncbi:hypothetical protein GCM10028803_04270 [Larkinella knui]